MRKYYRELSVVGIIVLLTTLIVSIYYAIVYKRPDNVIISYANTTFEKDMLCMFYYVGTQMINHADCYDGYTIDMYNNVTPWIAVQHIGSAVQVEHTSNGMELVSDDGAIIGLIIGIIYSFFLLIALIAYAFNVFYQNDSPEKTSPTGEQIVTFINNKLEEGDVGGSFMILLYALDVSNIVGHVNKHLKEMHVSINYETNEYPYKISVTWSLKSQTIVEWTSTHNVIVGNTKQSVV